MTQPKTASNAAQSPAPSPAAGTDELRSIAAQAISVAQKKGAQGAFASVSRERDIEVAWRDGKLEKISEATARRLALHLYVDGRYGAVSTSDLRPAALVTFIEDAIGLTRALSPDPARGLSDPARYPRGAAPDLQLEDPRYDAVTAEERRRLARELEEAARGTSAPGRGAIVSVSTSCSDNRTDLVRMASNGFEGSMRETSFWLSADVSAKDSDGRRPEDGHYAGRRFRGELPSAQEVGAEAARRALGRLGAKKGASAVLPMAVESRAAGRLVSFLLGPMTGGSLQQKRSFLEGKLGTAIGSPRLSISDTPLLPRGLGSRWFDPEGLAARTLPLFEGGVLRTYYVDNYYGRKLKMAPTTARPSNLSWQLGDKALPALLADMKDGILVTGFLGGNSNGTTGDFSLGVQGFRVRSGVPAEPIAEMNIAGNHLELWKRLVTVGNDPFPSSPLRTPSLVFDKVQFAGT